VETSNEEADAKSVERQISPFLWALGAIASFVIAAYVSGSRDSSWTIWLFSMPIIADVIGCIILWHRLNINSQRANVKYYRLNLRGTFACVASYCVLWIFYPFLKEWKYCTQNPWILQAFSILALVLIVGLLVMVAIMTSAFLMAASPKPETRLGRHCAALRNGIRAEPLWAIAVFFVLFLGVSYLFGFALAFHDQYALKLDEQHRIADPRPALRMRNLRSIDDKDEQPQPSPTPTSSREQYYFYFNDLEARLQTGSSARCEAQDPPDRANKNLDKPKQFNECSLKALSRKIDDNTKENKRIRITLIGHTSDEQPGSNQKASANQKYLSNYELSEARAQDVKFRLIRQFANDKWRNIEWLVLPASSETMYEVTRGLVNKDWFQTDELKNKGESKDLASLSQDDFEKNFSADELFERMRTRLDKDHFDQEQRGVAVLVQPVSDHVSALQIAQIRQSEHRPLNLMDYMYFSIYTITTTGYGDIVPTTSYAKFVTSLANICEVLFLVVFFNALISIRGGQQPDKTQEILDYLKAQSPAKELDVEKRNVTPIRRSSE
jgi:hypothetical protein